MILDTHVLLWILQADPRITPEKIASLEESDDEIFVSAVSAYEIVNKHRISKLPGVESLVSSFAALTQVLSYTELPVTMAHAHLAARLPGEHKDPFDRILSAQSMIENMPVMTMDEEIRKLGGQVVW